MKISFVVPAYNEEQNIGKCLESIIKEIDSLSLQNESEIIMVDNNSSDNSTKIAANFNGVKVLNETKKGPNYARALGLSHATGDLVANIDSDNILPSGWIKNVLEEFENNPELVCLSGPLVYREFSKSQKLLVEFFYYLGYGFSIINNFLGLGSMVQGGNYVVRRDIFVKAGGHNTSIGFYGDDSDICRRLVKYGEVKFTFKLPVNSSGRRLLAEGIVWMGIKYGINYFWVLYLKRPFTKEYQNHR